MLGAPEIRKRGPLPLAVPTRSAGAGISTFFHDFPAPRLWPPRGASAGLGRTCGRVGRAGGTPRGARTLWARRKRCGLRGVAASNDDLIRGPTDRQYMVRSGLRARARRAGLGAPVARDGYLALFLSVSTWYARPTRFPSPTPTRSPRDLKGSEVAAYMIPDLVHDAIRARTARICQRRRFGSESDSHRSARFWARRRTSRASTRGPRGRPRVRRGSRRACRRTPSAPTCPCDVSAVEKPTSLTRSAASPFMSAPTTPTTYRALGGPRARL